MIIHRYHHDITRYTTNQSFIYQMMIPHGNETRLALSAPNASMVEVVSAQGPWDVIKGEGEGTIHHVILRLKKTWTSSLIQSLTGDSRV